jgi:vitamin B12 transporter
VTACGWAPATSGGTTRCCGALPGPASSCRASSSDSASRRTVSSAIRNSRRSATSTSHALTLFRDRLEDEINGFAFDPALGGFTSVNEDGTSHRQGVEWHSSLAWASGFLRIGANNLDTEDIDGSREIRRPEWQGFATLTQDWRRLRLDLGAFYVDEQIDLDFATWPAERVTLDAYTLAHGELSYELRPGTRLGLRGTNLLDETYEDILGYRAPGRAWYLKLGVDL